MIETISPRGMVRVTASSAITSLVRPAAAAALGPARLPANCLVT
jgi:hypothetical protein